MLSNPLFIATRLAHPAYVSYLSPRHLVTLSPCHTVVRVAPYKFFGYQREMIGDLPVLVAQVEKALVDSLDQLRHAGGLAEHLPILCAPGPAGRGRRSLRRPAPWYWPFLLTALTVEHLCAEKVLALLIRGKARDLYDL